MGFFKELYEGNICPLESTSRPTKEYKKAMHELTAAADNLRKALNAEQIKLLDIYSDKNADVGRILESEAFRQGFIQGAELKKDLCDSDSRSEQE